MVKKKTTRRALTPGPGLPKWAKDGPASKRVRKTLLGNVDCGDSSDWEATWGAVHVLRLRTDTRDEW